MKDIKSMIPFIAGIVLLGGGYWLSETPLLDKVPESAFKAWQGVWTAAMIIGGALIALAALWMFGIWKRKN